MGIPPSFLSESVACWSFSFGSMGCVVLVRPHLQYRELIASVAADLDCLDEIGMCEQDVEGIVEKQRRLSAALPTTLPASRVLFLQANRTLFRNSRLNE